MLYFLYLLFITGTDAIRVIGGEATVIQGGMAVLPCKLVDNNNPVLQITWQRQTKSKPQMDNFYTITKEEGPRYVNGGENRFSFIGNFAEANGTLQLADVELMDEGAYVCIFTVFRVSNQEARIPLTVLVPPVTSLKAFHPVVGPQKVDLVSCTAHASKPPAQLRWVTDSLAENVTTTAKIMPHDNGTATTISTLHGVPSRGINNQLVKCVVSSEALVEEETHPINIQIDFPPLVVNINQTSRRSFKCWTEANPAASFTWTRSDGSLPQSGVSVNGPTLQFSSEDSNLSGLYMCQVSNRHGKNQAYLFVQFSSGSCPACWVLLTLLIIFILAAVAAGVYLFKTGKIVSLFRRVESALQERRRHPVPSSPSRVPRDADQELDEGASLASPEATNRTPASPEETLHL